MSELDLILFAALAVFLGWKLYSVLGRRTGNERPIDPFGTPPKPGSGPAPGQGGPGPATPGQNGNGARTAESGARQAPRLAGPANDDRPVLPREQRQLEAVVGQAPEAVKKGLEAIRAADPEFDSVSFLAGAKIAFDMILHAFAAGDANALKPLLSPDVLQQFTVAIADRQQRNLTLKTTLVGIVGLELAEAEMKGPDARIRLKLVSQQVNVTQDSEGRIVDGHPNEVATITDIWTFSRPVTARDPNWQLIATESPH